jgi:N-formylglutamate amidohydrolase
MYGYSRYVYGQLKDEKKPETDPVSIEVNRDEKLRDIEDFIFRSDEDVKILPLYLYDWMDELNLLEYSEEEKIRFYNRAILSRQHDIEVNLLKSPGDRNLRDALERIKTNIREGFRNALNRELAEIHTEYKKLILIDQRVKRKNKSDESNNS